MKINKKYDWIKPGVKVNFHSIIGEPATEFNLTVETDIQPLGGNDKNLVVWLKEKSGCVSIQAITPYRISLKELKQELKKLAEAENFDPESDHCVADDLLLRYINDPEIEKLYNEIQKWYA